MFKKIINKGLMYLIGKILLVNIFLIVMNLLKISFRKNYIENDQKLLLKDFKIKLC